MDDVFIGIRFVGGSWDNRVVAVARRSVLRVIDESRTPSLASLPRGPVVCPTVKLDTYHLHGFMSEAGTLYWQYLHESLSAYEPPATTYSEAFAPLDELTVIMFDQALRGIFYALRGRHVDTVDGWDWPRGPLSPPQ